MTDLLVQPCNSDSFINFEDVSYATPFQCDITVHLNQTSRSVNHVNNIEYLRWIDRAAQLHSDACGWTRQRLLDGNMMWFVARHEIEYLAEVTLEDTLRLSTWVEDIRRVKSRRSTIIHALKDTPVPVCTCNTLWVLVDLQTRRPISIPKEMAIALKPSTAPRVTTK